MSNLNPVEINQVSATFADFTPSLTPQTLNITSMIAGINPKNVIGLSAAIAVTGVNGTWTTAGTPTPVVGVTYRVEVKNSLPGQNRPNQNAFEVVATTTSFADLINAFVTAINNNTSVPYTADNNSTQLRLTEAPPTGYAAGEVRLVVQGIKDSSGNVLGTAFAAGTAHVDAVGQYAQIYRKYVKATGQAAQSNQIGNTFVGAPVSGKTYITVKLSYYNSPNPAMLSVQPATAYFYADDSVFSTTKGTYLTSTISNYAGQLGISAAGAAVIVTPIATAASAQGIIPTGANIITVAGNASNFVGIPLGLPVGYAFKVRGDGTAYKLQPDATEAINEGTPASGASSTIPASNMIIATKTTTTNWTIYGELLSGTHASSTSDIPASS